MTRVRPATLGDARAVRDLHVASIHRFGPEAYNDAEVEAWASTDDSDDSGYPIGEDDHYLVVAERAARRASEGTSGEQGDPQARGREVAGFGHLAIPDREVTAVYVHPDHANVGVGSALLAALEGFARGRDIAELWLVASLNAVNFYERVGYERVGETTHETTGGVELDCVEMRKYLGG